MFRMIHRLTIVLCLTWFASLCSTAQFCSRPGGPTPGELGRSVNPFIGTGGLFYLSGNETPGACVPFGMARLSPDTVSNSGVRALNTSGYYYRDERLLGFSHTRLVGTGAVDGGQFLVVPAAAPKSLAALRHGLEVAFTHQDEAAFPGYYTLNLPKQGLRAELTATRHVGVHRYTFSADGAPHLLMQVTSALGRGNCKEGEVHVRAESNEIEGSVRTFGTFTKRYGGIKVYFVARCDKPFASFQTWKGSSFSNEARAMGSDVGADLVFDKAGPNSRRRTESRPLLRQPQERAGQPRCRSRQIRLRRRAREGQGGMGGAAGEHPRRGRNRKRADDFLHGPLSRAANADRL